MKLAELMFKTREEIIGKTVELTIVDVFMQDGITRIWFDGIAGGMTFTVKTTIEAELS